MSEGFGSAPVAFLIVLGLLAIALTSFLSAVEIAISRLSRAYVEDLVEEGTRRSDKLLYLVEHRRRTNLSLRGARVSLQTMAIVSLTIALVDIFDDWSIPWWGTTLIAILVIGIIEFLGVSLLPILLVNSNYVVVALTGTTVTTWLVSIFHFFDPLTKLTGLRLSEETSLQTQRLTVAEDLREIADEVGEAEHIDEEDKEMLRSVFEFGQTIVREVMVPRTAMVSISATKTLGDALSLFNRSGYSRVPVIAGGIDDVVGILYFKDVVQKISTNPESTELSVRSIARPPVFIPEMRLADDELRAMQAENTHLALVVDEYGGIAGLVTMEDLLEELVGEMTDEHDRFEMEPEEIRPGQWRVPSRFPLNDLEELLDIELESEEVDSVGGLLATALEKVPIPGDNAVIEGVELRADEAVGRRHEVVSIVVSRTDDPTERSVEKENERG